MSSRDADKVCNFLKSKGIQLPSNNAWLSNCIRWYNSHLELRNVYGSLEEYVCIQWLLADLQDVQHACLPLNCEGRVLHLNSKYSVQINWMRDIGKSCYSQLQTVQKLDESESYFSEDEPKKASWEPSQKRVLMMEITDGINALKAMEYSPIPKFTEHFLPGTKVVLSGPIECRNGILFLKNDNVTLLGGEVEQLYEKNSLKTILSNCLNIDNENEVRDTGINNRAAPITYQPRSHNSNIEDVPNPAVVTNRNDVSALDINNYMFDEDDEFLCELPDEILDHPEDLIYNGFNSSPVLDVRTFDRSRQTTTQHQTVTIPSVNKPLGTNKPKLFPSLEDLRPVGREPSSSIGIEPTSSSTPLTRPTAVLGPASSSTPFTKSTAILGSNNSNNSFGSSVNQAAVNNTVKCQSFNSVNVEQGSTKPDELINLCDDDSMDYIMNNDKYPEKRRVEVKVDSITKLKIRNGEWFCCASVLIDNQLVDVTFSNQVLETLFGIPATEVEVWRGEMSTNPSLKKKVNDILKVGQTKLKILKCPMTLEYSSDDCTPEVIAIHVS